MSKLKMWVVSILAVLILGGGGWTAYQAIAQKNSLNHSYAFAYKTKDRLSWFEVSENKGKVTGHLNEKYIEEERWHPNIYKKQFVVSGSSKENGYEFKIKQGKETIVYEVHFSGKDLSVKKQGEKKSTIYKAINEKKLDKYHKDIQNRYDYLFDTAEDRFYDSMRNFKEKVAKVYGFLYTAKDKQLFLQVKTMHIELGWSGSLLITTVPGEDCKPYKEMRLEVMGDTDGRTFVMGHEPSIEDGIIKGSTDRDVKSIKLPFKMTGGTVELKAVTKQEYQKQAKAFKKKAEEKKK
ncbi:hypothetical protein M5E02_18925 [Bacillus safensis]|uniref:hypothetical protein n=1 Tax=Bacillus safensis TaxID=561879 RepID=UPI0020757231|nr:hypothetical protein [Bacillus safensis]USD82792.1 hypothetical protein M5E02_18925 [Bacillus safensis]